MSLNTNAPKYPVCEIFDSIEGEGKRAGQMATFIRLSGCNLKCSYCDTMYAHNAQGRYWRTAEQLLAEVEERPWDKVTLTGGEPLIHDVQPLLTLLSAAGYEVNVETNGSIGLSSRMDRTNFPSVFYTADFKCWSSGETNSMTPDCYERLTSKDVLKFVVGNRSDMEQAEGIIKKLLCRTIDCPSFYFSPVFRQIEPREIVEFVKEKRLREVNVQVQLHKVIWDPMERGV